MIVYKTWRHAKFTWLHSLAIFMYAYNCMDASICVYARQFLDKNFHLSFEQRKYQK